MGINTNANQGSVIQGENYRFTILTPSLVRMEYEGEGKFEDRASQIVMNRFFEQPKFQADKFGETLVIRTEFLTITYETGPFHENNLEIQVLLNPKTGANKTWHYGEKITDLGGTARTLDEVDGETSLGQGLISKEGYTVIDDSKTMIITEDGWVEARKEGSQDLYFFGYGHRYQECIRDFYKLSGKTPLIPRWALGNWWSRYHKYTESEYKELITRFQREQLPFTVAVIDMDWHLVDIPEKYGSGWTGYTWNKELFPEPSEFLDWLHEQGMKVTLNVHPADGIRAHEEAYTEMAEAVGINPKSEKGVSFDIADPDFLKAYFEVLHYPKEEEGVDFWWIDWQQGNKTNIPGLDPLWMLNHFHYIDSMRKKEYGLTFSRYAGIGSHRYPIGFSGDTIISWKSLAFQPYFTANASNVGYGWWSHDIGGHMFGTRDDELSVRWMQFGVFSPINRLHSSNNPFSGKEPWNYNKRAELIMGELLRLRHAMIPYLYSMNRYASREGCPLIRPLYWKEPEQKEAYEFPNEYYFGSELLIAPITEPMDKECDMAKVNVWLPEGIWFDYQGSRMYKGGKKIAVYRSLEQIPIFVKAGGIFVRSTEDGNTAGNPGRFALDIFPGNDGNFTLWEDCGISKVDQDENWANTTFSVKNEKEILFRIEPVEGNQEAVPQKRSWQLNFRYTKNLDVCVKVNKREKKVNTEYDETDKVLTFMLEDIPVNHAMEVVLKGDIAPTSMEKEKQVYEVLNRAQISYDIKQEVWSIVQKQPKQAMSILQTIELPNTLMGALAEILCGEDA